MPRAYTYPRLVASFSCVLCCARDEVREPAPERTACWSCKNEQSMRRYYPDNAPPLVNARQTREGEL